MPVPLVRANQWTMVACVLVAGAVDAPWILLAPWCVALAGFLGGPARQPVFRLARPVLGPERLDEARRQSRAAQRFNSVLSFVLLTLALLAFYLWSMPELGWTVAVALGVAALGAIRGFCVGCGLFGRLPAPVRRVFAVRSR